LKISESVSSLARFKLLIISFLLVVGLLPGLLGLVAIYDKSRKELLSLKGRYFQEVATFTAFQVQTVLKSRLETIDRLTLLPSVYSILSSPGTAETEIKYFKRIIEPEMANKGIVFKIYNTNGEVLFSSDIIYPRIDPGKAWSLEKYSGADTKYVSDVKIPPNGENYSYIEIYAPVKDESGKNIGFIVARYVVDRLFDIVKKTRIGKSGHANLVISTGEILVCPIYPPKSHKVGGRLQQKIFSGSGWSVVEDDAHGATGSLVGFSPINLSQKGLHPDSFGRKKWVIFTRQEPSETFQSLLEFRKAVGWYAFTLAVLVMILGVVAFRRIMKAQKAHQADVVHKEKAESIAKLIDSFQEMMFNPLGEFGKEIDKLDREVNGNKRTITMIKKIRHHLSGFESLIQHLRYYTLSDKIKLEPVDFSQIVLSSISMLDYMSNKKSVAIKFTPPEEEVILDGEPKLLNIVILNICLNAIHASGEAGGININIEKNRSWAVCTIEDSGIGISKKEIESIFDPFFTTKKGHKGYGLGLAVSKGIIERHNGKISVKSYHGKGTIVSIRLKMSKKKK